MMRICKTYDFSASHRLPHHGGKCKNLHGHNYKLEVEIEGGIIADVEAPDAHMVMDFVELDALVKECVLDGFDHMDLNAYFKNPTAEGVALHIAGALRKAMEYPPMYQERDRAFGGEPRLVRVRLWETEKAFAEWRIEDNERA